MEQDQIEVPDEVIEAQAIAKQKLAEKVEAFGASLMKYRDEAVTGRTGCGIEDDWTADEEAYQGVDDANRDTVYKPASAQGSFTPARPNRNAARSTVYLNITRPYVDAAAARVADMLLPNDETNWDIRPTPIPDGKFQQTPVAQAAQPNPAMPDGQASPVPPVIDPLEQMKDQARKACDGAKRQIEDWLVQCQWHSEVRKSIEDAARLGTGILKGPTPAKYISRTASHDGGMLAIGIKEDISPETRRIDPWNFFPDPSCGEDIHNGGYVWEKDEITAKQIRELKGMGYLDDQLDKVLEQGPQNSKVDGGFKPAKVKVKDSDKYEIWYFHGLAEREDLEAAGVEIPLEGDVSVPAIVTMINDVVVKAALNPLDSGEFPYDLFAWQRRAGVPWGMGVARQINTPQRMLNAATRNMMDNAAFTAGPQLIIRKGVVEPADGQWSITPRKIWWVVDGADINAAKEAFISVNIPTQQEQLNNIIQFALKMAEDVTGLPMLMQGSQGSAPDTVGGMTIVNNNANVVLRRIIRTFDDRVTEPHIRRYYEYLLMYGEDESIKGDYQVDARGSTALIERDFQNNEAAQILQLSLNPAFDISPKQAMREYLKSRRFDAKRFDFTDEEKKAQEGKQQAPAPAVQVAQINAQKELQKTQMVVQSDQQIAQMEVNATLQKVKADTDRDLVYVQSEEQKNQTAHDAKMAEIQMKWQLAQLEYANKNQMTLEQVKAQLATDAAKINLQRELAHLDAHTKQVLKPPVEPAGRAPNGQAFTQ